MKALVWLVIVGCVGGIAFVLWTIRRRELRRKLASEQRSAEVLAEAARASRDKAKTPGPGGPG